ncbi:type II toxin-antitoxin system HicB family antitoxin [Brevibacillus sp. NPDC058079]|uniref:type II toxin-antitoxin system HicB family antitoxin n=1 Tax=Brevibacillus sp. NPDC058079 TaxID=3346330 RepID=UPI0036F08E3B
MEKDWLTYPSVFHFADDGISVSFPDFPGCLTCGDNQREAMTNAKEALGLHVYGMEIDEEDIPSPTKITEISIHRDEVVVLVEVYMPAFRQHMKNKAVKKTLTIPAWLDKLAMENKVNFSHILQDALKKHLGVD